MLATASRMQLQRPAGMRGSQAARPRAAAPQPAARLAGLCPLPAPARLAPRADRRALHVTAAAASETAPIQKLSGDELKEANRKEMRTVSVEALVAATHLLLQRWPSNGPCLPCQAW